MDVGQDDRVDQVRTVLLILVRTQEVRSLSEACLPQYMLTLVTGNYEQRKVDERRERRSNR